jgi:hypothetical protein
MIQRRLQTIPTCHESNLTEQGMKKKFKKKFHSLSQISFYDVRLQLPVSLTSVSCSPPLELWPARVHVMNHFFFLRDAQTNKLARLFNHLKPSLIFVRLEANPRFSRH